VTFPPLYLQVVKPFPISAPPSRRSAASCSRAWR
jgi:hypothetical protein